MKKSTITFPKNRTLPNITTVSKVHAEFLIEHNIALANTTKHAIQGVKHALQAWRDIFGSERFAQYSLIHKSVRVWAAYESRHERRESFRVWARYGHDVKNKQGCNKGWVIPHLSEEDSSFYSHECLFVVCGSSDYADRMLDWCFVYDFLRDGFFVWFFCWEFFVWFWFGFVFFCIGGEVLMMLIF